MPSNVPRRTDVGATRDRWTFSAAIALLVACIASACSHASGEADASGFSGPWAADFARYTQITDSEFAHRAFADSQISDSELQEGDALIAQCYRDAHATVTYDAYGFETVQVLEGDEDPVDVMGRCALADGGVSALYHQIERNPGNDDDATIIAACMVSSGLVDASFTAQDYRAALDSGAVSWNPLDERSERCAKDPLGLVTGTGGAPTATDGPGGQ